MDITQPKWVRSVGGNSCEHRSHIKYGKTKVGKQRFLCKSCKHSFVESYKNKAWEPNTNRKIKALLKEGVGTRSISRLLHISKTTVTKRILAMAANIHPPILKLGQSYQLDEMCTFLGYEKNRIWIAYALDKENKAVVSFSVGKRTNKTLRQVTNTLLLSNAKKVYTDKLKQYGTLLPKEIHIVKQYGINHIERMNLTLRTHLKRLNRRTICYSKSIVVLSAVLTIYFWG